MRTRLELKQFEAFWKPLAERPDGGIYFCRIAGYSAGLEAFLNEACAKRAQFPMRLTGKLPNPNGNQLYYLHQVLGEDFSCDVAFFDAQLKKWLPRLSDTQRAGLAQSIYQTLLDLRAQGKNDGMLKNAYLKFLCWMYYRFEQLLHRLGQDPLPKIVYDGALSAHELQLFCVLAQAGCDILLLEPQGDSAYQTLDPKQIGACLCAWAGNTPFPSGFSLEKIVKEYRPPAPRSTPSQHVPSTPGTPKPPVHTAPRTPEVLFPNAPVIAVNTWLSGDLMADSLRSQAERATDQQYFYTMFVRILGVEDKSSYARDLFLWRKKLEDAGRRVTILESLPIPTPDETARIVRVTAHNGSQVIAALLPMFQPTAHAELDAAVGRAFATLMNEMEQAGEAPTRMQNRAIYLICWFNRYFHTLFQGYAAGKVPVLFYFGVCHTAFEALFLRFLARLPIDVIEIDPRQTEGCVLTDKLLFERVYMHTLPLEHFPTAADSTSYSTAAYHAEQELNQTLYQDSGLYRSHQYQKATVVSLQTMCEEVYQLWDQQAVYRPGFEVVDDTVFVPVLAAKVSGVKNGDTNAYWTQIKRMMGQDTICITRLPYLKSDEASTSNLVQFIKNRKLQREALQANAQYPYRLLRPEVQNFLLDKVQALLDSGLIRGTFSQGMEYKILSVAMRLPKEIVRIIQKTDFTKDIPKIAVVATGEAACSLEDSILLALLHLACFDVVLFVPTGYQIIESYYTQPLFAEHQAGDYFYDLQPPYLGGANAGSESIFTRLFRRGHT